jgi:hypothetical protein
MPHHRFREGDRAGQRAVVIDSAGFLGSVREANRLVRFGMVGVGRDSRRFFCHSAAIQCF